MFDQKKYDDAVRDAEQYEGMEVVKGDLVLRFKCKKCGGIFGCHKGKCIFCGAGVEHIAFNDNYDEDTKNAELQRLSSDAMKACSLE